MIVEVLPQAVRVSHYVDIGTGSIIIQVIIGAVIALPILIKTYWRKIKNACKRKKQLP